MLYGLTRVKDYMQNKEITIKQFNVLLYLWPIIPPPNSLNPYEK
jgi:hypothetical protein